ncbi:hypothetical protein BKA56DRAFT_624319 [Ilyonectria sp. MPI-CAGE-AT-0026]|nr:hypothetical protein BKA56DRAFT_624319 [Ilyonectria sp. MPI-CAGE-AT-0026]
MTTDNPKRCGACGWPLEPGGSYSRFLTSTTHPASTACGHAFCKDCWKGSYDAYQETHDGNLPCPYCKTEAPALAEEPELHNTADSNNALSRTTISPNISQFAIDSGDDRRLFPSIPSSAQARIESNSPDRGAEYHPTSSDVSTINTSSLPGEVVVDTPTNQSDDVIYFGCFPPDDFIKAYLQGGANRRKRRRQSHSPDGLERRTRARR